MTHLLTRFGRWTAGLATVSIIFSTTAFATVLHDEAVDGDLPAVGFPSFNLILGLNEVNGFWPATPGPDSDRFDIVLSVGLKIDSISLSYNLQNGEVINTGLSFNPGNLFDDNFVGQDFFTAPTGFSASFMDTNGPGLGALDTTLALSVWGFTLNSGTIFSKENWFVDIQTSANGQVSPVPLPAALPLFAGGLGLMGLMGWRKKRTAAA